MANADASAFVALLLDREPTTLAELEEIVGEPIRHAASVWDPTYRDEQRGITELHVHLYGRPTDKDPSIVTYMLHVDADCRELGKTLLGAPTVHKEPASDTNTTRKRVEYGSDETTPGYDQWSRGSGVFHLPLGDDNYLEWRRIGDPFARIDDGDHEGAIAAIIANPTTDEVYSRFGVVNAARLGLVTRRAGWKVTLMPPSSPTSVTLSILDTAFSIDAAKIVRALDMRDVIVGTLPDTTQHLVLRPDRTLPRTAAGGTFQIHVVHERPLGPHDLPPPPKRVFGWLFARRVWTRKIEIELASPR